MTTRIVFVGAVEFSRKCLQVILGEKGNIVGVLNPSREAARLNSDYVDLEPLAHEHHLPFRRFEKISDPDTVAAIRAWQPDVLLVLGLSQLITEEVIQIPPLGCIGSHPSLLPLNRGRHPLIWALVNDLTKSGLSFFLLDQGVDTGDIVWQRQFAITDGDDASSLYFKIEELAAVGLKEFLPQLENGPLQRQPQDHSKATVCRRRTEADGQIDWNQPRRTVFNLIRALARPYPGAHSFSDVGRVTFWRSRIPLTLAPTPVDPGRVLAATSAGLLVACQDGPLEVLGYEAANHASLSPGMQLWSHV